MTLLDFARGPALQWTLVIFVIGVLWRLVGVALLRTRPDLSEPRNRASWKGLRLIVRRSWPRSEFLEGTAFNKVMAGAFHLGIFVALLFYLPHVLFLEDIFKGILGGNLEQFTGLRWPTLSTGAVAFFGAVAVAALVALLVHRLTSPVKRLISNFNDYLSWFVTIAPLVTGLLAYAHAAGVPYQTLLAVHILSAELLLLWFPFGKLMHTFFIFAARGSTGMLFERKGASL